MSLLRAAEKALDGKAAGKKAMSSTQHGSPQGKLHLKLLSPCLTNVQ